MFNIASEPPFEGKHFVVENNIWVKSEFMTCKFRVDVTQS